MTFNLTTYSLQDLSRLHVLPSPLQRPLDFSAGLTSRPRWELEQLGSKNRWTNVQSLTGLGKTSGKLQSFQEKLQTIKEEAKLLVSEIGANETSEWMLDTSSLVNKFFLPFPFCLAPAFINETERKEHLKSKYVDVIRTLDTALLCRKRLSSKQFLVSGCFAAH